MPDSHGQAISREAPAGQHFVFEYTSLYSGISVHDPGRLFGRGIENANSAYSVFDGDGTYDWHQSVRAERKIPATMFPDYLLDACFRDFRSGFEQNDTVGLRVGEHLLHLLVGNSGHKSQLRGEEIAGQR